MKNKYSSQAGKISETTSTAVVLCENCDMCQVHRISLSRRDLHRVAHCTIFLLYIFLSKSGFDAWCQKY